MATEHASPEPSRGHEQRDASAPWIFGIVLFLLVAGLSIHFILAGFLHSLNRTPLPTDRWRPVNPVRGPKPLPRLQLSAPLELQAFRSNEEAELHSYGWMNRTAGVARIPIERAMELVLQQGLPSRRGTNQNQAGPSTYDLMRQRPEHREPEIKGGP